MSGRVWLGIMGVITALIAALAHQSRVRPPSPIDERAVVSGAHPYSLIDDPLTMIAVERRLGRVRVQREIVERLEADLEELARRPGVGTGFDSANRTFEARWLRDPDARFELVALVPRLDRAFAEPGSCGELRRIYRLALTRPGRPTTRLPMTLSQISLVRSSCRAVAQELLALPRSGAARVEALAKLFGAPANRIEVNLQNLHGTATPQDNEDHAEYLLRSFDIAPDGVREHPLLATPRDDLSASEKDRLRRYLDEHSGEVASGTLVIPREFLAVRAISVSPRGLARERNRVFQRLFPSLPRALLRRLDQGTCQGCHQSRAVAGFHLLGEERDANRTFNALRVGVSNHLAAELPWREAMIEALAGGRPFDVPRPFAEGGNGKYGERCGLGDPGFAAYTCEPGLACMNDRNDELGACLPIDGPHEGDACEPATVTAHLGPSGDHLSPLSSTSCRIGDHVIARDACLGNGLGFPGGMCTDRCTKIGERTGDGICAELPMAGYEQVCFRTWAPIEQCLATRLSPSLVRACDATHPCRDDYACARVPGGGGACVPPYFVFQARVDGPRADR